MPVFRQYRYRQTVLSGGTSIVLSAEEFGMKLLNGHLQFYDCVLDCENLIRKMLVVDPKRRISIGQIKHHRWMESLQTREDLILRLHDFAISDLNRPHNADSYNEHILSVMQNARIDRKKTIEVGHLAY